MKDSSQTGRTWVVAREHPAASDQNAGSSAEPFATIGRAAAVAEPGDTVLIHRGLYREWVRPKHGGTAESPIVYQAAPDEQVIVSGAETWQPQWKPLPGHPGIYEAELGEHGGGPFRRLIRNSRGGGTQGLVILNDQPLTESISLDQLRQTPGSWLSVNGRSILLHGPDGDAPPTDGWQVAARSRIFGGDRRGLDHIVLRGLTFQHAGNDASFPQVGAVSTRSGFGWVIEDCVIRWNKTIGLDCGQETPPSARQNLPHMHRDQNHDDWNPGGHLIRGNHIHDNGQCGIAGYRSPGTRVVGNRVIRNGYGIPGFETAGIKFHSIKHGRVEGNLVIDNRGPGIWLDTGYDGAVVHANVTVGNEVSGVMIELGHGHVAITDNYMIANEGAGFYSHDASDVSLSGNLIALNQRFGVMFRVATGRGYTQDGRRVDPCEASRNRVHRNTLIGNVEGEIGLPMDMPRQRGNRAAANLIAPPPDRPARFELSTPPALRGLEADAMADALNQMNRDGGAQLGLEILADLGDGTPRLDWADWQRLGGHGDNSSILNPDGWSFEFDREKLTIRVSGDPPSELFDPPNRGDADARFWPAGMLGARDGETTIWPVEP